MQVAERTLEILLSQVQKPARYAGGEWNACLKDWSRTPVRMALAYPDVYEIGMSNLGLAILYELINDREGMLAERVYAPWPDMQAAMRKDDVPLFSLETRHSLDAFDLLGFTLQYELTYTNVLQMLHLAGIPLRAADRQDGTPLVIAGGSSTYNPEPMAAFFDLFVLGEGEEITLELLEAVGAWKADHGDSLTDRERLLRRLARIPGVYVPGLYRVDYHDDGRVRQIAPTTPEAPERIRKRIMAKLPPAPVKPIVPNMRIIHDRASVEIQRGCPHGCRFCQAGIIYRPIRERPKEEVLEAIDSIIESTGYEEVGLVSLSSSDHSQIKEIVADILACHPDDVLSISLPSLRIDSFSVELADMIQSRRKTGFTFAPEAGSQRLRDVINKGVTEEDLMRTTAAAFEAGWNRIKLYFMIGLPTETDEDVAEIARLIRAIKRQGREIRGRRIKMNVSVATFVPKPHTPFQWQPLAAREDVRRRVALLRDAVGSQRVRLSWSDWDTTWLEAILSRGDRRLAEVIYRAWRQGAQFDAWSERHDPEIWRAALTQCRLSGDFYALRERSFDEVLPWAHVDTGVSDRFLSDEYRRALRGELSPDCRQDCHHCGILVAMAAERRQVGGQGWGCP